MSQGRVVNFELPADDLERAQEFYREVFDWVITPIPEMSYTNLSTGPTDEMGRHLEPNGINGGMAQRHAGLPAPSITVSVPDLDATLSRIEQLGGKLVQGKFPVGDLGFSAYFADPEGNVIGLWQDLRPGGL